ncbi:MAG: type IV pilin protein [Pseudomonadota bacterium]|nr:type IV pilin protein [Pseudomonadota bacterium]
MKRRTGFTLIEVLIVLAIVAILSAIAYPAYAGYLTRTRRIEGQIALLEAVQQQELYFTRNNTYIAFSSGSTDPQAQRFKWWSGSAAAASAYELRAHACPGLELTQCVEVQATPGTAKVDARFKDADCATLTLNSAGEHAASGPLEHCWP